MPSVRRPRQSGTAYASLLLLLYCNALVDRLDEHVRRPGSSRGAISPVEVDRRTRRLDLFERHPLRFQITDPIADHHEHVAIRGDVGRIRQPATTGDDPGAALRPVLSHR